MFVIGLIGGIASGKSLVAAEFGRLGAGVLDADRAGHQVLELPEVEQALRARWGPEVFDPQGRVQRRALARIVFAPEPDGPRELAALEQITHPRIRHLLQTQLAQQQARGVRAVVLDAPVLLKAGWRDLCHRIVFVDAPQAVRLARARERGWSEEEFHRREAAQELLSWKRSQSDAAIDNSGPVEATQAQVCQLWQQWQGAIAAESDSGRS